MSAPNLTSLPYTSTFEHGFDAKGRVTVPSEWRTDRHEKVLVLLPSDEGCLKVYPASWLGRKIEQLAEAPVSDPRRKSLERLSQIARTVECDGQGRIILDAALRERAGLSKKAVLAGSSDHFQIWDAGAWHARQAADLTFEQAMREAGL